MQLNVDLLSSVRWQRWSGNCWLDVLHLQITGGSDPYVVASLGDSVGTTEVMLPMLSTALLQRRLAGGKKMLSRQASLLPGDASICVEPSIGLQHHPQHV
jgi:hypothetical protein